MGMCHHRDTRSVNVVALYAAVSPVSEQEVNWNQMIEIVQ